jgi:hypothetical protein
MMHPPCLRDSSEPWSSSRSAWARFRVRLDRAAELAGPLRCAPGELRVSGSGSGPLSPDAATRLGEGLMRSEMRRSRRGRQHRGDRPISSGSTIVSVSFEHPDRNVRTPGSVAALVALRAELDSFERDCTRVVVENFGRRREPRRRERSRRASGRPRLVADMAPAPRRRARDVGHAPARAVARDQRR